MAKKTNFEVNGKQYFRITRTVGHKADGRPIKKQFYGTGINKANQKADKYINNLKLGLIDGKRVLTINILFPNWIFGLKKVEVKPSTFESYYSTYKNFIESLDISDIPINDIKTLKLQSCYTKLREKTTNNNVKKVHKVLNMFFSYAEKEGYIVKNPCNNISLPKETKKVKDVLNQKQSFQYYSEDEIKKLKEVFKGNKFENIILFALGTGMRRGEIFGLQWSDIDFENREIKVVHNLSYVADISQDGKVKRKLELQTPKTENSIRVIPMSNNIYKFVVFNRKTAQILFSFQTMVILI